MLNYMALAGYDATTSMEMLPNVLNLAAAGGMELATASDMITDSQSALGLSLEETTELVDKMAKASSKTNTSVSQLGDAILTVGGTAKNLAGGTTELTQVLGLLADNGIKASESGTHLRNIMLAMTPSTEAAAGAMEAIGLNAYDANGKLRPLQDIFIEMNAAMEDMTDLEKQNIITSIFNKTDLASVNALLSTTAERWDEVTAAIDDAGGAAAEMADTQLDNLQGDLTIMQSALEGAQIALSDKLAPAFRGFVQAGTEGLGLLTEALKNGEIEAALQPIGDALSTIWDAITSTTETVFPVIEEAFTNLQEAVQPIIDRFNDYAESGQLMDDVTTVISDGVTILTGVIAGAIETLADIIDYITTFVDWLNSGDEASENFKTTVVALTAAFVAYKTAVGISSLIQKLTDVTNLQTIAQKALNLAMEMNPIGLVVAAITGLIAAFGYLWNTSETFRNFWILIWNDIKENFQLVADAFVYWFTVAWPEAIDYMKDLFAKWGQKILDIGEGVGKFFKETIPEKIQAAVDFMKGLPDKAKQFGKDFIEGLWNGINNMTDWIKEKIKGFGDDVLNSLKDFFGIHSPSTVMRDIIGSNLVKGLAEGITKNKKIALSSVSSLASDLTSSLSDAMSKTEDMLNLQVEKRLDFSNLATSLAESVSAISSNVKTSTKAATVTSGVSDVLSSISGLGNIFQITNNTPTTQTNQMLEVKLYLKEYEIGKAITPIVNAENMRLGVSLAR